MHVTLCAADWPAGLPTLKLIPGMDAARSVLWATAPGSHRLSPHEL